MFRELKKVENHWSNTSFHKKYSPSLATGRASDIAKRAIRKKQTLSRVIVAQTKGTLKQGEKTKKVANLLNLYQFLNELGKTF